MNSPSAVSRPFAQHSEQDQRHRRNLCGILSPPARFALAGRPLLAYQSDLLEDLPQHPH